MKQPSNTAKLRQQLNTLKKKQENARTEKERSRYARSVSKTQGLIDNLEEQETY